MIPEAGEDSHPSGGPRRLPRPAAIISLVYAGLVVLTAPYMGTLRRSLETAFPDHYVLILKVTVGLGLAVVVGLVIRLVLTRTLRRLLGVLIIGVLVGLQIRLTSTPYPQIDWVERIHFFEYSLMSILFWWALKSRFLGLASSILAVLSTTRVGVIDEFVQWIVPVRVGDIRDIELNFVSGLLGQLFVLLVILPEGISLRLPRRGAPAIFLSTALLLLSAAFFFGVVHTGHVIRDPGIGEFRSRYRKEELIALAQSRVEPEAVERAKKAVNSKRRYRIRDFYLSEGISHIWARNDHATKDNLKAALKEQGIIEGYYPAVLLVNEDRARLEGMLSQLELPLDLASFHYRSEHFSDVLYTGRKLYLIIPTIIVTLACLLLAARLRT